MRGMRWGIAVLALGASACAVSHVPSRDGSCPPARDDGCPRTAPTSASCGCEREDVGMVCEYAEERCRCGGFGWYCEPIACPTASYRIGEPCDVPGVGGCAPSEGARAACPDPERRWIACNERDGAWGGFCPPDAPDLGAPCCITAITPARCDYAEHTLACDAWHWRAAAR